MNKNELESLGIEITGLGHYYPEKIVTNEEIRSRLKYPEMHPAEKAVIGNIGVTKRFRSSENGNFHIYGLRISKKSPFGFRSVS
jgi:3-oxoacyl-[acyl-carrier-protein] synthase III